EGGKQKIHPEVIVPGPARRHGRRRSRGDLRFGLDLVLLEITHGEPSPGSVFLFGYCQPSPGIQQGPKGSAEPFPRPAQTRPAKTFCPDRRFPLFPPSRPATI